MCEQRKRAVKILRIAADIILGAVLLALITLTVYIFSCNMRGEVAEVFGVSVVRVLTGSMEPSIREGDYIIIRKTDAQRLNEGDIICFRSEEAEIKGKLNTHRIMSVTESGFVTKGDANKYPDEAEVSPEAVIGKYDGKIGFLRWLSSFASAEKLIFVAVVLILTFIAVFEVRTIAKVTKEQRKSKEAEEAEEKQRLIREAIDREKQKLYERQENSGEEQTAPKETEEKEDKEEQEAAEN